MSCLSPACGVRLAWSARWGRWGGEQSRETPPPSFAFAEPPPGAQPCQPGAPARPARASLGDKRPKRPPRGKEVLADKDWWEAYALSPTFQNVWQDTQKPAGPWPAGYVVRGEKLYHEGRLCIPEAKLERLLKEHHEWNAHVANHKLAYDIGLRFEIPPHVRLDVELEKIRRYCLVCQASHPPIGRSSNP